MKRIVIIFFIAICLVNDRANAQITVADDKNDKSQPAIDSIELMKAFIEYSTAGPMHELMASWSGTWMGETSMWDRPGAVVQKATTTCTNKMIMGGRYQVSNHSGNILEMPFEGMGIIAYDNASKQFTSTWIDNFSTGIMVMTGNWDEAGKTLTLTGKAPDMMRPGKEISLKQVIKVIDNKTQVLEMYGPDLQTGDMYKMMEIIMKRKAGK